MEQLEHQRPEQRRNRDEHRRCQALAAIRQPRLNNLLESRSRENQPSGRRSELKANRKSPGRAQHKHAPKRQQQQPDWTAVMG